jgi:hypothetical protein
LRINPYRKALATTDEGILRMTEYLVYMSLWFILIALVAAINLRWIIPGVLAFFGFFDRPERVSPQPPRRIAA